MSRRSVPESLVERSVRLIAVVCLAVPATAFAQDGEDELALPPRLDNVPSEARLAALPEERAGAMEEVIVTDDNPWRLPDLGSAWRVRQSDVRPEGRISGNFLPLYDPEDPSSTLAPLFPANREMQRVGFIQIFRVRFGGRDID